MTGVTLTSTTTAVTLEIVERIDEAMANTVNVYTFGDGTEELLDEGRNSHSITITGVDKTDPVNRLEWVNTIMDNQEEVAVTGLGDTYFNTDYRIIDLNIEQGPGEGACPLYHFSITLERIRDRLG